MPTLGLPVDVPPAIPADAEASLASSAITLVGRMPNASNATFLVRLDTPGEEPTDDPLDAPPPRGLAIYKPIRGERPLWDFPNGLFRREVAAYRLGRATGLDVIPPTVERTDAPLGIGSLQWFVDAEFSEHYFSLLERPALHPRLRQLALFDLLANNTDRKAGHCLFEPATELVWGIDNGLCFSLHARLRTVIWDFAGSALTAAETELLAVVGSGAVGDVLAELLADEEITAVGKRATDLLERGEFPDDDSGRGYPWPLL